MDRDERYGFGKRVTRRQALRTVGAAAVGVAAASAMTLPAGAAPLQATPEQHPATQDVFYDGGVFDAGGAVLNLGDWPGFWQDMQHQNLIDQFQKDFNCTVNYDGSGHGLRSSPRAGRRTRRWTSRTGTSQTCSRPLEVVTTSSQSTS